MQQSNENNSAPAERLLDLITSSWKSQAICTAAQLNLADHLKSGPKTSEELAAATGTLATPLHRLLRALATLGICEEQTDGRFKITPMGELLAADSPQSLHAWSIWWGQHLWPVWGKLLYSIQTGKSARTLLIGTEGFDHLKADPQVAELFNQALAELTRLESEAILKSYDFTNFKNIIDIGGGYGEMLVRILQTNPTARGIVFDLPHAADGATAHFRTTNIAGRCTFAAGEFFTAVPPGGDAYILKNVLHDWEDDQAGKILGNCRTAMTPAAKLLVIERILPDRMEQSPTHQSNARADLNMLVALGARERSEAEFQKLLGEAGFNIIRILPAGPTHRIIEASIG